MDDSSCSSNNIEGLSRRNAYRAKTTTQIIVLDSDDDESQSQPHLEQPKNSFTQIDLQTEPNHHNTSEHLDECHTNTCDYEEQFDNHTESSLASTEFIQGLKARYNYNELSNAQASTSSQFDTTRTSDLSTSAMASTSMASSPISNHSAGQRSQLESVKDVIQEGFYQNMANNLSLNNLMRNAGSDEWTALLETIVKQTVTELSEKYDMIPKNATPNKTKTSDGKTKKKRKHHHVDHHRSKQQKLPRYSSTSSLDDSFGSQPSTSKYSGRKKNSICFHVSFSS